MQTINLDISERSIIPVLHAKQGDVGRKFKVIITEDGSRYPIPERVAVSVWYSGASGEGNYTDIGANSAVSVSENEIVVELITQMLTNPGAGMMCLVMNTADGDELGTWNIPYCVEPRPGMNSEAAQTYFTAFSNAVQNLPYPDASLSIAGKAADAAAVGAALENKAPAGYGLGGQCKLVDNWNNAIETGFYASAANSPDGAYWYGYTIRDSADPNRIVQVAHLGGTKCVRTGTISNSNFGAWEYENPPMLPGVEYCTTKRYKGRQVYCRVVHCGWLAAGEHWIPLEDVPVSATCIGIDIRLFNNDQERIDQNPAAVTRTWIGRYENYLHFSFTTVVNHGNIEAYVEYTK